MPTVLLTGFEPFEADPINPSWEIARALDGRKIGDAHVVACQLPCVFARAPAMLAQALESTRPVLAICLGLAGGRDAISIERVAINLADARIPDNSGAQPLDEPVIAGGPNAYFAPLPVKAMAQALAQAGLPATVSHTAGTFLCNQVFYWLCHHIATQAPCLRGGFIHVPYSDEMAARHPGKPTLALTAMVQGVELAIRTALATRRDAAIAGGTLH